MLLQFAVLSTISVVVNLTSFKPTAELARRPRPNLYQGCCSTMRRSEALDTGLGHTLCFILYCIGCDSEYSANLLSVTVDLFYDHIA